MLRRDAEHSHLTQSRALIPLQPRQPGTTSSLGSGVLPGAAMSREEAPGRSGAGNVSCATGQSVGTAHGIISAANNEGMGLFLG